MTIVLGIIAGILLICWIASVFQVIYDFITGKDPEEHKYDPYMPDGPDSRGP